MNQAALELDTLPAQHADRIGFEVGWDHARHGLVPAADRLHDASAVEQGWLAGKAVLGKRTLGATRHVRQWLELRAGAWRRGERFDHGQVTPQFLAQIEPAAPAICPVTRQPLGGAPGSANSPVIERIDTEAGYAAGNLLVISRFAATARAGCNLAQALANARAIDAGKALQIGAMDAAAWWRLAVLISFVTPLPALDARRVPLRALPPPTLPLRNAAQRLQLLLTLQGASPGWSRRVQAVAAMLADPHLRHDFNLFIGALAPRLLEVPAGADSRAVRHALEDAWADARVNRRWQHFIGQLTQPAIEELLLRAGRGARPGPSTAGRPPKNSSQTIGASVA